MKMLDAINIAGTGGAAAGSTNASRLSVGNVAASFEPSIAKSTATESISPRIKADPFAGVIVQFLDSNGEVRSQTPSAAAVAYLKAGLTMDGAPRGKEGAGTQEVVA
jgi:hypothetical protein